MAPLPPLLLSGIGPAPSPALACVHEFEQVLGAALGCETVAVARGEGIPRGDRPATFIIAISYAHLVQILRQAGPSPRSGPLIAFVFDAFLSPRLLRLPGFARRWSSYVRLLRQVDRIFAPMRELGDQQAELLGRPIDYLPIGVDALSHGSGSQVDRWIDANGYGRQPPHLTAALSAHFNAGRAGFFHHTDHMRIGHLVDVARHRAMFWQMLRASRLALAYAPEAYDPDQRFACSFVGQRWYESLAAGCVVVGRRPRAAETAELIGWPDATIELPDDPGAALDAMIDLARDGPRLAACSARNHRETLARHDWRLRTEEICARACPDLLPRARLAANRVRRAVTALDLPRHAGAIA